MFGIEEFASEEERGCFSKLNSLKVKYKERLNFPLPSSLPIEFEKLEIDKGIFNEMVREILEVIKKYSQKKIEQPDISKLTENAKRGDFIAINILKPIFESLAENLKDRIPSNWNKGYCPLCGGPPLMAELRKEDGKRLLQCTICKTKWEFLRIKCPYCETEKETYLKFFQTEDESPYRIDLCDNCKSYIKTLDKRKMDIQDLEKLDIETRYLDILAMREGYTRYIDGQLV